ncbi:MAG: PAS domain S-box protein [bacterium]
MSDEESQLDRSRELRQAAGSSPPLEPTPGKEVEDLLHELQVHQIELEMQNEELRRTQKELEASRTRYMDLYDLAPVGYCTLSEDGVILEGNLAVARLLGVGRGALVKQLFTRFILEEDQVIYYLNRKQLFETSAPQVCQFRMLRANADPFWAHLEAIVALDANGALVFHYIINDINDRQRAEELLRHNLAIITEATDAIITTKNDEGFTITNWNSGAEKTYGWKKEEVLGRSSMFLQNEYPGQDPREVLEKILETGLYEGEVIQSRKDGTRVSVEVRLIARKDNKRETTDWICINRDITDRKRVEEALQESEAKLSNALQMAHAGHWEYDVDRDLFTFNDNFYRIFRTTAAAVGGYQMSSQDYARKFCHPDDIAVVANETRVAIESTDPNYNRQIEHRILYADGEAGVITVRFFIVKDPQGRTIKTYGVNQDITERKRAEEALRESEVLQRILLDNLPAGVVIVDPVTRVIERVNDHVASLFGAPVDHLVGQRCHSLLCPTSEGACPVLDLGQDVDNSDRVMLRMDGSRLPILKTVKRIQLNGKEKLLECFVDVSERKRVEEALRESEERYRQLFELASDALFLSATDTGLIVEANAVASELYGYDRDELLTKKSIELSAEPGETERSIHEAQITPDQVVRIPLRLHRKKDGTVFPVEITARSLFVKGRRLLLAAARDITDRKQLEEQIRQVRSDLLFAVSHDLKSPLQSLHQTQEMLNELTPGEGLARFQEYSEIWRRNLQRLERMINNLVDSQRGEEGRFPLLLASCDPVELIKRVVEDSQGYALSSHVTFDLNLQPVPRGVCDEEALSRVVENLLTNAVKFSPKGGKVEVRLGMEEDTLLLEVEDHGLGIPAQEQAQLFQPFQRGSSAQQRKIPGTGLGLYVSRRIVEEHGGSITLASEEGKGTVVTVRLPWEDGEMGTDLKSVPISPRTILGRKRP